MNEFEDIERELRQLRPAPPSEGLQARMAEELVEKAAHTVDKRAGGILFQNIRFRWAASFALAAAFAIIAFLSIPDTEQVSDTPPTAMDMAEVEIPVALEPASPSKYIPVKARHVLMNAQEEGIFYIDDHIPARKMRYRFVDSYTWKNPDDGSSLQVTVPREEVLLVCLETY